MTNLIERKKTPTQYFALIIGIAILLLGIMGFIPAFVQPSPVSADAAYLGITSGYGNILGLIPTNVLLASVRVVLGLLGILAANALDSSRLFSGALAIFYGVLAVLGLFAPTQSMLGLMPLFGGNILLHASTAAIAAYFGFVATPDLAALGEGASPKQSGNEG